MSRQLNRKRRATKRRARSRVTSPSHSECGPVTITRADGSVEVQRAFSEDELRRITGDKG